MQPTSSKSHFAKPQDSSVRKGRFGQRIFNRVAKLWHCRGTHPIQPEQIRPTHKLSLRVLKTRKDRQEIVGLRQYAPVEAERDLDAGVTELDALKDEIGVVMAFYLEHRAIATIRAVPCGRDLTLTEKTWKATTVSRQEFGAGSWELGRLIVAPEHRRPDVLTHCMTLALRELIRTNTVTYFHASCAPSMTRLYRRFGFKTEKIITSDSGLSHALIRADVNDVSHALNIVGHAAATSAAASIYSLAHLAQGKPLASFFTKGANN